MNAKKNDVINFENMFLWHFSVSGNITSEFVSMFYWNFVNVTESFVVCVADFY